MKNIKTKFTLTLSLLLLPLVSHAQLIQTMALAGNVLAIVNSFLIPLAFSLALLFFFWGVAKYIRSEGQGKDEGRRVMVWGVVALFVMASIWALVFFVSSELGVQRFQPGGPVMVPSIAP